MADPMTEAEFAEEVRELSNAMNPRDALAALMVVVLEILHGQPDELRYELARSMIGLLHKHSTPGTA